MLDNIQTEENNQNTIDIDISSSLDIARMINNEDLKVAKTISSQLENIAVAIDIISQNFLNNGRLLYFGAGTSGRLAVLDASECPPTFNTPPDMVQGIIAGGDNALRNAIEGAEDDVTLAKNDFSRLNINNNDTVVAISASGNANYVAEILSQAKSINAKTIAITCNPKAKLNKYADVIICTQTGAEVITGSTRMKAGSAHKMVLNMLSTGAMIKIGKTYKNFMVDVKPTNIKLKNRAIRIVSQIANTTFERAEQVLKNSSFNVKVAILQLKYSISETQAKELLYKNNGILRKVFSALD